MPSPVHTGATPLTLLYQARGLPPGELPPGLRRLYGGPLGLPRRTVYSNFVTSLDGVAVVGPSSGSVLSQQSQEDRLVMGLLRSLADVVLIGSGTLHGSPGHVWTPEHVYPRAADLFQELRRRLGLKSRPVLAVATGSGRLDLSHPGLSEPALILTSNPGAQRLGPSLTHRVLVLDESGEPTPRQMVRALRQEGHLAILTEGGPRLLGQVLKDGLLDQLFLTLAPTLAGRTEAQPRAGMIAGVDLLGGLAQLRLLSARRGGSHLFLRYRLLRPARSSPNGGV
ncbi:MAG: dihydrofolate reductase family protein [Candidatus Dormibacteria bacterium]